MDFGESHLTLCKYPLTTVIEDTLVKLLTVHLQAQLFVP